MALPPASLSDQEVRERIDAVPHWYHQIEIRPGIVTPGINASREMLEHLRLPERGAGLRALDIGVRDGFFAFELERRGAEVVAMDYLEAAETGFPVAKELLGSEVSYRVDNVYRLARDTHGVFDLVLFLGVLYHLRDPLLALDRIWDVLRTDGMLIVETQLLDQAFLKPDGSFGSLDAELNRTPLMQFYPGATLRGDPSNYWAPNMTCLRALLETAGFDVEHAEVLGSRGVAHARRVVDPQRVYQRLLEKGTLREAQSRLPVAVATDAPRVAREAETRAVVTQPDAVKRLEHDLAIVRNERAGLETQLDGAQRRVQALEAAQEAARRRLEALELELAERASGWPALQDAARTAARRARGAAAGRLRRARRR